MGNTQVTSFHAVQVPADPLSPKTIKNVSGATLYGAANPGVSSTVKDWEIAEGSSQEIINDTWVVTNEKTDTEISVSSAQGPISSGVPANLPGRREIESVSGVLPLKTAAGVYATIGTIPKFEKGTALKFSTGETPLNVFYFDPKLYEITGRTTNLTLEVLCMTDAVTPVASFTGGVYKVEKVEGAEKKHEVTVEAVVTGSTAKITTPLKETATQAAATFPAGALTAGFYLLGLEVSAETADKSFEAITLTVFAND